MRQKQAAEASLNGPQVSVVYAVPVPSSGKLKVAPIFLSVAQCSISSINVVFTVVFVVPRRLVPVACC